MSDATSPAVVLVNDTSMINPHFGTQLVGQAFREQFCRVGLDLIGAVGLDTGGCDGLFARADLLVINGEGSIHHGRNTHLIELADRHPCALVNCVWQGNPALPALRRLRFVRARESSSRDELAAAGVECRVVPDVSFASSLLRAHRRTPPTEDLGVTDNVLDRASGFSPLTETPHAYLAHLCRFRRLCVGRFHAAVTAAVLGVPFSTWDSNTHKTAAMMRDMGVPHLHAATQEEALRICPREPDPRVAQYARDARLRVMGMFDNLAALARSLAAGRA